MAESDKQAGTWVSGYLQTLQDKSMMTSVGLKETPDGFRFGNILKHDGDETVDEWVIVDPATLEYECVLNDTAMPMTHRTVYVGNEIKRSRLTLTIDKESTNNILIDHSRLVHIIIRVKNGKTFLSGSFTPSTELCPLGHPQGPIGYMVWVRGKELIFVRGDGSQLTYQADLIG